VLFTRNFVKFRTSVSNCNRVVKDPSSRKNVFYSFLREFFVRPVSESSDDVCYAYEMHQVILSINSVCEIRVFTLFMSTTETLLDIIVTSNVEILDNVVVVNA
jgi:hypothetical protein